MTIAETVQVRHFVCPCKGEGDRQHGDLFKFEHLDDGSNAGPWYCSFCHVGWLVRRVGGAVVLSDEGHRMRKFPVRLRCGVWRGPDASTDLDIIVMAYAFRQDYVVPTAADLDAEKEAYFYEQHTCPENYLRDVRAVYLDGEEDPHGLFDFVGVEPPEETGQ